MEVIVEGTPSIYIPNGRFNFGVNTIELVGEGALKMAYDKLKKKLDSEGLFDIERKKLIPELPERIGLITSETGAVIHDFLTNIGKYGFKIKFFNSRVEGQLAIKDLLSAIEYFEDKDIDVLVIIRGGGSLESLQAFNNEVLIRKIADFEKPVICGIGHDKDVPLCALVADLLVSTPTAVTTVLNRS
jgi:exodeoxyribonuclease VII large subunit